MPRARKLDLADDRIDQDPAPVAPAPRRGRPPGKATARKVAARTSTGRIMSKAQMTDKVRAEVGMYLGLVVAGWEIRDPICAQSATQERLDVIADRVTSMIARSDSMLELAAKSGILGDIIALIHAALPIISTVWAAHRPGGHGHKSVEEVAGDYAEQFPAYAGAAR